MPKEDALKNQAGKSVATPTAQDTLRRKLRTKNDYVELPIGSLISELTNCTFTIWVDFSNAGGNWQRIFDFGSGTGVNMFLTPRTGNNGPMRFAITIGGNAPGAEDQTTAPATLPSSWHHVAVVIDPDNTTHLLYIDGEVVAENTAAR